MLILNMWKELYQNCYSVLCCQYDNSHYNLPGNIDFSNVKYSNIQSTDIQSNEILVCPGILTDSDLEVDNTIIEDEYYIIDEDDINI